MSRNTAFFNTVFSGQLHCSKQGKPVRVFVFALACWGFPNPFSHFVWLRVSAKRWIAPKDIPLGFGGYTVWIIKYEWMPNRWLGVWNKRGNCLEFYDKAHAEFFLQQHPESIHGHPFRITPRTYSVDDADQMEYGTKYNVWENE